MTQQENQKNQENNNFFRLKRPCADCPFRADRPRQKGWLGYRRAREISTHVLQDNGVFQCHKTLYQGKGKKQEAMCAGALSMLHNATVQDSPFGNAPVQIAQRLGWYDPATQNHDTPVFADIESMAQFHANAADNNHHE